MFKQRMKLSILNLVFALSISGTVGILATGTASAQSVGDSGAFLPIVVNGPDEELPTGPFDVAETELEFDDPYAGSEDPVMAQAYLWSEAHTVTDANGESSFDRSAIPALAAESGIAESIFQQIAAEMETANQALRDSEEEEILVLVGDLGCFRSYGTIRRGSRGWLVYKLQRWLNQNHNQGLSVDGIFGPRTEGAVKNAQRYWRNQGKTACGRTIAVDGIVGPQTWTLVQKRRGATPQPPIPSGLAGRVKAKAVQEHRAFGGRNERNSGVTARMQNYWRSVGWNPSASQIRSRSWQYNNPWSAAFVSYVMKQAGAGSQFRYHPAHWVYIADAKRNVGNRNETFWAFDARTVNPKVGDLVCKARAGSGLNFSNVQRGGKSHCDIVTEVHARHIVIIGGNVGNTVKKQTVSLKSNGRLNSSHFAIVRIMK